MCLLLNCLILWLMHLLFLLHTLYTISGQHYLKLCSTLSSSSHILIVIHVCSHRTHNMSQATKIWIWTQWWLKDLKKKKLKEWGESLARVKTMWDRNVQQRGKNIKEPRRNLKNDKLKMELTYDTHNLLSLQAMQEFS